MCFLEYILNTAHAKETRVLLFKYQGTTLYELAPASNISHQEPAVLCLHSYEFKERHAYACVPTLSELDVNSGTQDDHTHSYLSHPGGTIMRMYQLLRLVPYCVFSGSPQTFILLTHAFD